MTKNDERFPIWMAEPFHWLLGSGEPWTRYRTLVDLLGRSEDDPDVQAARAEMLAHPQVQAMIAETTTWGVGTDFRKLKYPFVWYNVLSEVAKGREK